MKVYKVTRKQFLPTDILRTWEFFSSPRNLAKITPSHMGFNIVSISGREKMYPGQIIEYKINVLPYISCRWITEIRHVKEPYYFVDEQRFGPYAMWHHQHHFEEVAGGVEMTDEVHYAIPYGPLGRLANWLFVEREVNAIFDYRTKVIDSLFQQEKMRVIKTA